MVAVRGMWLAGLVVMAAIAGCFDAPGPSDEADDEAAAVAPLPALEPPTVHHKTVLGRVDHGAEPSVLAATDGALYVVTQNGFWRSTDGGASFESLGVDVCVTAAGDPTPSCVGGEWVRQPDWTFGDTDLIEHNGALILAGLRPGVPIWRSTDQGGSWQELVVFSDGNDTDRQWIATDGQAIGVIWRDQGRAEKDCVGGVCVVGESDERIDFAISKDGGATWTVRPAVPRSPFVGPLVAGARPGTWLFPILEEHIRLVRTADDGLTWTEHDVGPRDRQARFFLFPALARDDVGVLYLVWSEDPSVDGALYGCQSCLLNPGAYASRPGVFLSMSADEGETWTDPERLTPPGTVAVFPWVAAGAAGRAVVTWYESVVPGTSEAGPNAWQVRLLELADVGSEDEKREALWVTPEPTHVGSICTFGGGCDGVVGDRTLLDFFEVTLTRDGQPFVAWAQDPTPKGDWTEVAAATIDGAPLRAPMDA